MTKKGRNCHSRTIFIIILLGFCFSALYYFMLSGETTTTYMINRRPESTLLVKQKHHSKLFENTAENTKTDPEIKSTYKTAPTTNKIQHTTTAEQRTTTFGTVERNKYTLSKTDEITNTTSETDEITNTNSKTDEITNTTSKTDEITNTTSETDEITNTTSETDEITNTTSETDEITNTTSETDEITNTTSETDEITNTTSKTDEITNTTSETDEIAYTISEEDEIKQSTVSSTIIWTQSTASTTSKRNPDEIKLTTVSETDTDLSSKKEILTGGKEIQQSDVDVPLKHINDSTLIVEDNKQPVFVLLLTYARSGSSWLGSITSWVENSMYLYEPFKGFLKEGFYMENKTCFFDNTCKRDNERKKTETSEFAIETLHNFYTCQFTKLDKKVLDRFIRSLQTPSMNSEFQSCMKKYHSRNICLPQLEEKCLKTSHRIIKTIRISMETASILINQLPNLRIIHLVRDPRGITNSRQHSSYTFRTSVNTLSHSNALCDLMKSNMNNSDLIRSKYPDRVTTVFYESMAERPIEGARFVYNFMKSNLTETIAYKIHQSAHADIKTASYFGTKRSNSSVSAYAWRKQFELSKVKVVDSSCRDVYEKLGFVSLDTKDKLMSMRYPSRVKPRNIEGFI